MIETILIVVAVFIVASILWFLIQRNDRSWDTPSRPITPTPADKVGDNKGDNTLKHSDITEQDFERKKENVYLTDDLVSMPDDIQEQIRAANIVMEAIKNDEDLLKEVWQKLRSSINRITANPSFSENETKIVNLLTEALTLSVTTIRDNQRSILKG